MTPYYQDDAVTIYHGDCREILEAIACDAVVTDPPYGIGLENHGQNDGRRRAADYTVAGDGCQGVGLHVLEWAACRNLPTVFFASPRKPWPGDWRNLLVWDKGGAVGGGGDTATCWKQTWELVQVANRGPLFGSRDESVLRYPITPKDSTLHACQKPLALMRYLLAKLGAALPVDPFMGSGTTLRAAKDLGRKAIGIEIEERYCEIAAKRMQQEVLGLVSR